MFIDRSLYELAYVFFALNEYSTDEGHIFHKFGNLTLGSVTTALAVLCYILVFFY